jgi:hypothetical protein
VSVLLGGFSFVLRLCVKYSDEQSGSRKGAKSIGRREENPVRYLQLVSLPLVDYD